MKKGEGGGNRREGNENDKKVRKRKARAKKED